MNGYKNPVKIINSSDWYGDLKDTISDFKILNPIVVTSPGNKSRLDLGKYFSESCIFSFVPSNPSFVDCSTIIKFCKAKTFDSVIAIGGGSVMDLAKVALSHLSLGSSDIHKLIAYKSQYNNIIPSIFIPTTHGTASEVTMWGTIWDMNGKKKYSISNYSLYPDIAILDGKLALSLPMDISITTILDALSHSFEAIWNKNANLKSTKFAEDAICLIFDNVFKLKKNPNDLELRNNLMRASTIAGLAFSNTATAAAHSISYPLTIHHSIPHGIAASITLTSLLEINQSHISNSLNIILDRLNLGIDELANTLLDIPANIISFKLKDWGVRKSELSQIASESFTKGRKENNIINLSEDMVLKILMDVYS